MITKEQSNQLKDYFPVQDHEFIQGATYLSEEAITDRLDEVDPSWEFHRLGEFAYRDNSVIATFRMTVCGVSRDGIGMWDLTIKKKDGTTMSAVDPEKSVSTDALKRAARLFGIGRYILEMRGVSDQRTLSDWLSKRSGVNTQTGEIKLVANNGAQSRQEAPSSDLGQRNGVEAVTPQPTAESAKASLGTPSKQTIAPKSGKWAFDRNALLTALSPLTAGTSYQERNNAVKKMDEEGAFADCADLNEATQLVISRLNSHKKATA